MTSLLSEVVTAGELVSDERAHVTRIGAASMMPGWLQYGSADELAEHCPGPSEEDH